MIERPGNHDPRAHLRVALDALHEEEARQSALTEAREKARSESWAITGRLAEARDRLAKARTVDPVDLAYSYARGEPRADTVGPAEQALAKIAAEQQHHTQIENVLDSELAQIGMRLDNRRVALRKALSLVVTADPVYRRAIDEHRAAWLQLRTAKEKLRILAAALQGQGPGALLDEISLAEPVEIRVGYPVITEQLAPLRQWLTALESDPAARLEDQ
jgi:hypothetical protein